MSQLGQFFEYTVLKALSKIMPNTYARAFEAAQVNRLTSDWNNFAKTLNSDIRMSLPHVQKRCLDLYQNDPYARKVITMIGNGAVGAKGFTLRNKAKMEIKEDGITKTVLDTETNQKVQDIFKEFCKKEFCTITGDIPKRECDKIMIQQVGLAGEIFKIKITGKGVNKFGLTYQYLESDLCDINYNDVSPEGRKIVMGIEYDEYRRPVNYYFKKVNIVMDVFGVPYSNDYYKIPANRVTHLFVRESFNQFRGIPWLAPSALRLKMLKGFEDASLVNARVSAMKTNIWEPVDAKSGGLTTADVAGGKEDSKGITKENVQPGQTQIVPKGYKHVSHDPKFPHEQHDPFRKSILKGVASNIGVSFIKLANSYEDANYTSTRGSFLDEQDLWMELHTWITDHDLIDTFETVLTHALLADLVDLDILNFDQFNKPHFQGRTWKMVNPKDEVKANYDAWKAKQKTLSVILAEQGMDFEETIDQFAYEKEYMEKKGVTIEDIKKNNNIEKGEGNESKGLKQAI